MPFSPFLFDPHQLRAARDRILDRFPLATQRQPPGLELLFQMMEGMDLNQAIAWGESLGDSEKDLLCRYFSRCTRPRALLVLTLILAGLKDRRAAQVARWLFLLLPGLEQWEEFKPYWQQHQVQELVANEAPWITRYLAQQPLPPQLDFVMDQLERGKLELDQLDLGFPGDSPLFRSLLHFLFHEGARLMACLHPDRAAEEAARYLDSGADQQVRNYLMFFPIDSWKPQLLQAIYQKRGVPNQRSSAFFAPLERGVIWSFRRALFRPELDSVDSESFELWERWIHRCFDLRWIQGVIHIYIYPFHIIEEPQRSLLHLLQNEKSVRIIQRDGQWSSKMESLLQEFTVWD